MKRMTALFTLLLIFWGLFSFVLTAMAEETADDTTTEDQPTVADDEVVDAAPDQPADETAPVEPEKTVE